MKTLEKKNPEKKELANNLISVAAAAAAAPGFICLIKILPERYLRVT